MPPRGGQQIAGFVRGDRTVVSSHAPARGATSSKNLQKTGVFVSSHAPARGATCLPLMSWWLVKSFKSCPREGGNSMRLIDANEVIKVSSHAPARGATPDQRIAVKAVIVVSSHAPARGATHRRAGADRGKHPRFKSCPREGGNRVPWTAILEDYEFQVMPPRGGQQPC